MRLDNLYSIVAITEKTRAIGKNNDMLYHLPEDLRYFKAKTLHHTIVMGYNTYMSFPKRPLPNRKNVVLTRKNREIEGVTIFHNVEEVLDYAREHKEENIFIVGGDQIYRQFMPYVSKLYLTLIEEETPVDAEAFFPEIDESVWQKVSEEEGKEVPKDTPSYRFTVWERKDL